jgi:hypothetical protein
MIVHYKIRCIIAHQLHLHWHEIYQGKNELNLPPIKADMKHILCLLFSLLSLGIFAQNSTADAVIYSENGDKFRIYLNEELINEDPRSNVKIKGLVSEYYQVRVDFEDAHLSDFTSKMFAVKYDLEVTYVIKLTKKGYALRYFSERTKEMTTQKLAPGTYQFDQPIEPQIAEPIAPPVSQATTTVTTHQTTTTTKKNGITNNEKVNVNVNMGGVNMGINMDIPAEEGGTHVQSTTTTTTTTTTSHGIDSNPRPHYSEEKPHHNNLPSNANNVPTGKCGFPMDNATFESAKSSIKSKSFSDSKMTLAKQMTGSNCLSAAQIKEIVLLFDFETDRLEYAKFANSRCNDPQNYFLVNDAFQFESTIDELNKSIKP